MNVRFLGLERAVSIALFTLSITVLLWIARTSTESYLTKFAIGDALAYARIAFNIVTLGSSTYDHVNQTNGFHPLWMLLQLPFYVGEKTIVEGIANARWLWMVVTIAAALVWRNFLIVSGITGAYANLIAALLLVSGWSVFVLYSGLETPLVLLTIGLLCHWIRIAVNDPHAKTVDGIKYWIGAGALIGVCFVARLDSFLITLPICGAVFYESLRKRQYSETFRRFLLLSFAAICVSAPYLAWNKIRFGAFTPISGRIKAVEGVDRFDGLARLQHSSNEIAQVLGTHFGLILLLLASGLVLAAIVVIKTWRSMMVTHAALVKLHIAIVIGAAIHYLYYFFFIRELNVPWHLYPQILAIFLTIPLVLFVCLEKRELRYWSAVTVWSAVLIISVAQLLAYERFKSVRRTESHSTLEVAHWLQHNTEISQSVAMFDSFHLGVVLWNRSIFDLNGLVGGVQTIADVRGGNWDALLGRLQPSLVVAREHVNLCNLQPKALSPLGVLYRSPLIKSTTRFRFAVVEREIARAAWRADRERLCF